MSRWYPPLSAADVKRILTNLGFSYRKTKGSHEQWVRSEPPPFRKVTVDCPKAPFSEFLVRSMARQAGVNIKDFYAALR